MDFDRFKKTVGDGIDASEGTNDGARILAKPEPIEGLGMTNVEITCGGLIPATACFAIAGVGITEALTVNTPAMVSADSERIVGTGTVDVLDRKSTRLNSSHTDISYAVFCLKKKNKK